MVIPIPIRNKFSEGWTSFGLCVSTSGLITHNFQIYRTNPSKSFTTFPSRCQSIMCKARKDDLKSMILARGKDHYRILSCHFIIIARLNTVSHEWRPIGHCMQYLGKRYGHPTGKSLAPFIAIYMMLAHVRLIGGWDGMNISENSQQSAVV